MVVMEDVLDLVKYNIVAKALMWFFHTVEDGASRLYHWDGDNWEIFHGVYKNKTDYNIKNGDGNSSKYVEAPKCTISGQCPVNSKSSSSHPGKADGAEAEETTAGKNGDREAGLQEPKHDISPVESAGKNGEDDSE